MPLGTWTTRGIVLTYISDSGLEPSREAIGLRCELADGRWHIHFLSQFAATTGPVKDESLG